MKLLFTFRFNYFDLFTMLFFIELYEAALKSNSYGYFILLLPVHIVLGIISMAIEKKLKV